VKTALADFIATGFYSGRCPWLPGTAGSAAAALLAFTFFITFPSINTVKVNIVLALVTIVVGIIAANIVVDAGRYGADNKDPKPVVIDEFAGYFVTIVGLQAKPLPFAVAFVAFRIFDILKPPPIKRLEHLPRGYGIVMDDVLAGVYAALLTRAVLVLLARFL
jgi:phosphatidylglycerophosphatase A